MHNYKQLTLIQILLFIDFLALTILKRAQKVQLQLVPQRGILSVLPETNLHCHIQDRTAKHHKNVRHL